MSLTSMHLQQKKSSPSRMPRLLSFGAFLVVLLLVSACGTIPGTSSTGSGLAGTGSSTTIAITPKTSAPTAQGATTPGTTAQGTTPINATVTYASVKITLVDVQQASSFADDNATSADKPGAMRIDFTEESGAVRGGYLYSDVLRLVMPDNTILEPLNAKEAIGPDASLSRKNWVDFAVPLTTDVKQLTLHFGTAAESPIDILLVPNTDVSKYQAKTAAPNKQAQYKDGNWMTNWTVTSVSSQLSDNGKQADKGMVYVVVSLKIDNSSQQGFNQYPGDYIRLKAGDATSSLSNYTIPLSVDAGNTNATGTCSFLVPQGNTSFTFVLLARGTAPEATIPFQIP